MSNSLGGFQIYPRGFLGKPLGPNIDKKSVPFSSIKNNVQFDIDLLGTQEKVRGSNTTIDNLYKDLTRAEGLVSSKAFREKIFLAAFGAFGTMDFYNWYQVQKVSPFYGDLSHRFLEDTVRFLSTGRRQMSVQSWSEQLTYSQDTETANEDTDRILDFFGASEPGYNRDPRNRNLTEIVQLWWSQPTGMTDLLYTLHILFGEI